MTPYEASITRLIATVTQDEKPAAAPPRAERVEVECSEWLDARSEALRALSAFSDTARASGDDATFYAVNRVWHIIYKMAPPVDRDQRPKEAGKIWQQTPRQDQECS